MALTGRAALVALLAVPGVLAAPDLWWLPSVALLVGVALDVALAGSVRGLVLSRSGPAVARVGDPVQLTLTVTNPGRRSVRGLLRDAWPPSAGASPRRHALQVPPGERRRVHSRLVPTRRGDRAAVRVTVRSVGPLGLAARQGSHHVPGALRVLPAFESRRHLPEKLARLRELDGLVLARGRGQGTEFDALRDYVTGDDVRSIDWRATARRETVVVRTWRAERDRRVVLVLDTGRTSAGRIGDVPRLDAAMDAALLLAALAARAGDHVELLAFDRQVRASVGGASRANVLPTVVSAMADLQPALVEPDFRALAATLLRRAHQRALVVLFTGLDPAPVEEGLLPALPALAVRHQLLVAAVADPRVTELASGRGSADAVYAAGAAEQALAQRRQVGSALRRHDVEVVDAPPGRLAPEVADAYLALKAAGRL